MKNDIRSTVTRKIIKDALSELMISTSFDKITIKEVCKLAKVSRSTFYSHYEDIYSLLKDFEKDIFESHNISQFVGESPANPKQLKPKLLNIFEQVNSNADYYRIFLNNIEAGFLTNVLEEYRNLTIEQWLKDGIFEYRNDAEYAFLFYKSGMLACMREWLNEPAASRKTPEEFSESLMKIMSIPTEFVT